MRRRDFLKLVIGGTAISLGAEPRQFNRLIPFLDPEDQLVPGVSTWYATSCRECPAGCGMVVRNREARATKAEGNPLHPINLGRLCARGQAALQGLYDPDRLKHPVSRERGKTGWDRALAEIGKALSPLKRGRIAVISDLQTGTLESLIRAWLKAFHSDRYLVYEPFNYEPLREANRIVLGQDAIPDYHLDRCDFIISFAADFLETWISPVKWICRFAETRVPRGGKMGKFVYIGPRVSMTAFSADEYMLVRPGDERWIALAMLQVMDSEGLLRRALVSSAPSVTPARAAELTGVPAEKIRALARQFARAQTALALAGLPVPGGRAAIESAVAANYLNLATETPAVDFGRTHALGDTARASEIAAFVEELHHGKMEALVIIGANPAYSLSPDYHFHEALKAVPLVIGLSSLWDETAAEATWALPTSHPLESWGDYEPETGLANLIQPVMGTRFDSRSPGDVLLALAAAAGVDPGRGFGATSFYDYLHNRWTPAVGRGHRTPPLPKQQDVDSGDPWQEALTRGGSFPATQAVGRGHRAPRAESRGTPPPGFSFSPPVATATPALWLYPSPFLHDGRGANKRWLQENPDPVTHAVWEAWVEVHPETAAQLGVVSGQGIEFSPQDGRFVFAAPAFIYPGVAPGSLAVQWGQGHEVYGRYADGRRGWNAFRLLSAPALHDSPFPEVRVRPGARGGKPVVTTDGGVEQQGRHLVEAILLSVLLENCGARMSSHPRRDHHRRGAETPPYRPPPLSWPLPEGYHPEQDLCPPHDHVGHRWAMAVDLGRCVGCGACVTACYAENNCAVVGKEWMRQGREMSWIRIERYYQWDSPHTAALLLPMFCQHCDAAPCETVCPVFAAAHTDEGLNAQVYNRCIGTRYCSNNCPYKVRRFNWRNWDWPEELTWQLNPDVTVRCRGVMEKCTFCVQRIREVTARAKKEGRPVGDGEIVPACAQTCPAGVFIFGDLMDLDSRVSRIVRSDPRRFQVLQELNTKPAVIYLRRVINDLESV